MFKRENSTFEWVDLLYSRIIWSILALVLLVLGAIALFNMLINQEVPVTVVEEEEVDLREPYDLLFGAPFETKSTENIFKTTSMPPVGDLQKEYLQIKQIAGFTTTISDIDSFLPVTPANPQTDDYSLFFFELASEPLIDQTTFEFSMGFAPSGKVIKTRDIDSIEPIIKNPVGYVFSAGVKKSWKAVELLDPANNLQPTGRYVSIYYSSDNAWIAVVVPQDIVGRTDSTTDIAIQHKAVQERLTTDFEPETLTGVSGGFFNDIPIPDVIDKDLLVDPNTLPNVFADFQKAQENFGRDTAMTLFAQRFGILQELPSDRSSVYFENNESFE